MVKLAPRLIRRAAKKGYLAVVLDPIYKVITGDENSADQMAKFCNQFDLVAGNWTVPSSTATTTARVRRAASAA